MNRIDKSYLQHTEGIHGNIFIGSLLNKQQAILPGILLLTKIIQQLLYNKKGNTNT